MIHMKPNIFLLTIDSVRAERFYGPKKSAVTPNFDSIIKNGLFFTQNIATSDQTGTSLASIFTGKYPINSGVTQHNFNFDFTTFFDELKKIGNVIKRTEIIFGKGWKPEIDTMDTFVDSSWYYVRYTDAGNDNSLASSDLQKVWLPVDFYSGGAEHTTMHLLYARFFYKAMRDCGLVVGDEPFKNRMNRSLILGPDGNKMSKSKGNVIDPDIQVNNVGADAVRMYLCFMGPYNEVSYYPWDPNGLVGVRKFLERVNGLGEFVTSKENKDIEIALHKAIKGVTESIEQKKLNTGVSALMILSNEIEKQKQVTETQLRTMSQLLAPYAPHLAEELWQHYDGTGSVHESMWPRYDKELLRTDSVVIPVQVNGKKIGQIRAPRDAAQDLVEKLAKSDTRLKLKITGEAKKVIYVKNRILNLVIDKNA